MRCLFQRTLQFGRQNSLVLQRVTCIISWGACVLLLREDQKDLFKGWIWEEG
jgi:hypothetical protein